ncbi:hypothetical protein P3X46_018901 [Hevea brasiliensis]|uniref:Glycosyltransferase n=1 Tax=Hevea brasiliensis TaxID=3981 RepID=A0ABQ9LS93_HEVBR|nr:anthocyanidin 3-O-glucosyltransferase 5 [Hevea brasiliensis]KAJ9170827.1 hypothetical protein P3X46_018901 [Hevea brasiliensis]
MQTTKPHAALLASPGMGHFIPVLELGKRLVSEHGFNATVFVVTTDTSLSQSQLLKKSHPIPKLLDIVLLPPVDISTLINPTTGILAQLAIMMRQALPSLRQAISAMKFCPTALIVDIFGTEAFAISEELNMLKYVFITSTAWFLALTIHLPTLDAKVVEEEHVRNHEPLMIPGCSSVRFEDTFEPVLDRNNQMYIEYIRMGVQMPTADGILVNTWQDLEPKTLGALGDKRKLGWVAQAPVYAVGPLVRPVKPGSSSDVLGWLDMQPQQSVVYVSFGSGGTLSAKQTTELAWGLELSEQRFIWVVRPPVEDDAAAAIFKTGHRSDNTPDFLPDGFLTRNQKKGLVVPMWAPQTEILSHPSVGGFLSHCGWNSTLESIVNGLPMIAWPLYAEQGMNATMLTEDIGVAVRLKSTPPVVVSREEIETTIRQVMEDKGDAIRARAKTLKSSAEKALSKGGSSYNSLSYVANDCEIRLRYIKTKAEGA